jgi:demethylmenaquinone methyltransferase / 2-methoxy-6-polyprenyl-1,4-benzoquinol methylase
MIKPYNNSSDAKKLQVEKMFDDIAPKYDTLNHLLSANIDKIWRNKTIRALSEVNHASILDIATGTGDLALSALKLHPQKITGVDISEEMLHLAREKVAVRGVSNIIEFQKADSEALPFADATFDSTMVAFGIRNFENLELGLKEINRVLKKDGRLAILEFSTPKIPFIKMIYKFYLSKAVPFLGKLISKNFDAYFYLFKSIEAFPCGRKMENILHECGYSEVKTKVLTFGIASLYICDKA